MNIPETLHALGVRDDTLTAQEKAQLDTVGYLPMPGMLSAAEIAGIRAAMQVVYAKEKTGRAGGPAESSYMQNKAPGFDLCLQKPRVLAAIAHVLDGPIKSFGVHGRPYPPGGERQNLHVDYNGPAPTESRYAVANSLWMLVDFTEKNGATRVIPGSHLSGETPKMRSMIRPRRTQTRCYCSGVRAPSSFGIAICGTGRPPITASTAVIA